MVVTNTEGTHENLKSPMGISKSLGSQTAPSSAENNKGTHQKMTEITNTTMKSK